VVYLLGLEKFTWYQNKIVEEAVLQADLQHRFRSVAQFKSAAQVQICSTKV
jgi:hypothetical protein